MELEVEMYVRTKEGNIAKIININEFNYIDFDNTIIKNFGDEFSSWYLEGLSILKASYNIIDLIEEGDYVNGHLVIWKDEELLQVDCGGWIVSNNEGFLHYEPYEEDIKSIVTKEQFESISYKVGEQYNDEIK